MKAKILTKKYVNWRDINHIKNKKWQRTTHKAFFGH